MSTRLANKVALICGASGGIGWATAQRFVQEGAFVGLFDRDERVHDLAASLDSSRLRVSSVVVDVTSQEALTKAVQTVVTRFGRIDILFNAFGGSVPADRPIDEIEIEVWQQTLQLDLSGTFCSCRNVLPVMKAQGYGVVVNMASGAALRGSSASHAYTAAKGGVVALTRAIAGSYARHNIRANAICSGRVNTERIRRTYGVPGMAGTVADPMDGAAQFEKYPFWFGQPEDVANIALFLGSDESRMITGAAIAADGGRSAY